MKKRSVILTVILLSATVIFSGFAEAGSPRNIKKVMKKYRKEEGFFAMNIPASIVRIMVPKEEKEVKDFLKDIKKIRFLIYDDDPSGSLIVKSCRKDMDALFKSGGYIDLLTVTNASETIKIRAVPDGENLKDLVIFVNNEDELVLINFQGSLDLQKMMSLVDDPEKMSSPGSLFKI